MPLENRCIIQSFNVKDTSWSSLKQTKDNQNKSWNRYYKSEEFIIDSIISDSGKSDIFEL